MQRVLSRAAHSLQILYITCHWDQLRTLGLTPQEPAVALEDLLHT